MRKVALLFILCMSLLCGCSSNSNPQTDETNDENYDIGYADGYKDGYADALEESLNAPDYSDELRSFQSAIASLMYDNEYDIIEKLMEYNRVGVEKALELEFGSKSIDVIKDYLDELSRTIIGTCELCGEPVYTDEFAILPEGITCAHRKCIP